MQRCVLLFAAASAFIPPAMAQQKATTRDVCERRCNDGESAGVPAMAPHHAKLAQIREQKTLEKDPEKRKLLDAQEEQAVDSRAAALEKICRHICQYNPER